MLTDREQFAVYCWLDRIPYTRYPDGEFHRSLPVWFQTRDYYWGWYRYDGRYDHLET